MIPREGQPSGLSELVARVDPTLCVSCGICAGSCAPMGVGPPGRTGRDQMTDVRAFVAAPERRAGEIIVIGCTHGAAAWAVDVAALGGVGLLLNAWAHLAATYDGAILRLYLNGNEVGSQALANPLVTSTLPLRIGGNAVWGEHFAGLIDEIRIYNRPLSPAEIQTDMATPIGPPPPPPPPPEASTRKIPNPSGARGGSSHGESHGICAATVAGDASNATASVQVFLFHVMHPPMRDSIPVSRPVPSCPTLPRP